MLSLRMTLYNKLPDLFFKRRDLQCGVNTAGRGLIGHQLATAWVKVPRLCLQMTNEADLLEAAITVVVTQLSSCSTVGMIVRVSDDSIKCSAKNED